MNQQSSAQKNYHLVLPGERLGVIEEFIPESGTYVKDGVIYSKIIGHIVHDFSNKQVSVYPLIREMIVPKVSTIILGQVMNVLAESAMIRIFKINRKKLSGAFPGVLHISDVQEKYVESMNSVCKTGDVIRAKVVSDKNQTYHLSTTDKDLGVIYAFCSNCNSLLEPKRRGMYCSKCRKIEERKTALNSGKESI